MRSRTGGPGRVRDDPSRGLRAADMRVGLSVESIVANHGLNVVAQPIVSLSDGEVVGYEALSRFPRQPESTPDAVFRRATESGFGIQLEAEAIRAAISELQRLIPHGAFLAMNVSPLAATSEVVQSLLEDVPADAIVLEITEQKQVDSYVWLNRALLNLRVAGVRLAVDDVGSGFANWGHIVHLQPDMIKLDGAWTVDIEADPVRQALVKALVTLGKELDAVLVAEQLESDRQLKAMTELGVELGQGYILCRPAPFDQLVLAGGRI